MAAQLTLELDINQQCIEEGIAGNCGHCPVALAVMNALPSISTNRWLVHAGHTYIETMLMGTGLRFFVNNTYSRVHQFMYDFDKGRPVSPFKETVVLTAYTERTIPGSTDRVVHEQA